MEDLPIDSIQHFNLIPDFVIPTVAAQPIIIRTTEGNFCIEGWELVEAARAEGKTSILCEMDELDSHSDEELCLRKDEQDRGLIIESLKSQLKKGPKALVGNRGYRKYLKLVSDDIAIDEAKIEEEARYDGKWVLRTNTELPADMVTLKYKELWQVEQAFRDMKSVLETRPVFHQTDETIRGHVFCSFLALVLRKELDSRLEKAGNSLEWSAIKQDLEALQEITIEEQNKTVAIRTECVGACGKIFQAVGVAIPLTIREVP
jgi:hypothetical protein